MKILLDTTSFQSQEYAGVVHPITSLSIIEVPDTTNVQLINNATSCNFIWLDEPDQYPVVRNISITLDDIFVNLMCDTAPDHIYDGFAFDKGDVPLMGQPDDDGFRLSVALHHLYYRIVIIEDVMAIHADYL